MVNTPKKKGKTNPQTRNVWLHSGVNKACFDAIVPYLYNLCSSSLQQSESNEIEDKKPACVQLKFKAIIRMALFMSIVISSNQTITTD